MNPAREAIARRILLRLVSFGEGRTDTRRQQPLSRLRAVDDDVNDFHEVLRHLINSRLLTIDGDECSDEARVDLAHEVIITAWPTLASWIQSRRADEQRRRQLDAAAALWIRRGRRAIGLLDGLELAEAETWRQTEYARDIGESPEVAALVATSKAIQKKHRRRRFAAFWSISSAAMLVIGGLIIRIKEQRELETVVAEQVQAATKAHETARTIAAERDLARSRAFHLFDTPDWPAAEKVWTQSETMAVSEEREYRNASARLENVLLLDPKRTGLRRRVADLTFERLARADRDHRNELVEELKSRLGAYGDERLKTRIGAHAYVQLTIEPEGTWVWIETSSSPRRLAGKAPLAVQTLPAGAFVLSFEAAGYATGRFPMLLSPDQVTQVRISLPPARSASRGMIYVPPGRFLFGAHVDELRSFYNTAPLHEVSTDGYFIARNEVTFGEWIEFLDELPPDERRHRTPQFGTASTFKLTELAPRRWRFTMKPTTHVYTAEIGQRLRYEGRTRRADQDWTKFPVSSVSYEDAIAFAAWLDRTGRIPGARLCSEYEWERAARGADGRTFPNGEILGADDANIDITYGRTALAFGPDEVGSHPASRSPVGANDMAGNVWEWTRSLHSADVPVVRGGSWYTSALSARTMNRENGDASMRASTVGVRLCATPRQ
jgi:eukaryotic-like serine/threonine-protein kinase